MHYGQTVLVLRRLLARIRDVMADQGSAQDRLDRIVSIIARNMETEVCTVYLRRAGDVLELFATEGLRPAAVHQTRLRLGEGIVGEIAARARPLAIADAQRHPSFAYRPETGEESFHSLMGVPIQRGRRVVGVLVTQSLQRREFTDEEIEALQTVAMVLAELVASGELIPRDELSPTEGIAVVPKRLEGVPMSSGLGLGIAVHHRRQNPLRHFVAENIAEERKKLEDAARAMLAELDQLIGDTFTGAVGEHREVIEAYRMLAEDVGWLRRIDDAIGSGLTAEAAVMKVQDDLFGAFEALGGAFLSERLADLEDLTLRLRRHLSGTTETDFDLEEGRDFVLVAHSLGPGQLLNFMRYPLRAVILEEGSPSAHVTIIARALELPILGQVKDAQRRIDEGDFVIVDVDHHQVFVRPGDDIRQLVTQSMADREARKASHAALVDQPAQTLDGVRIRLDLNAGLLADLQNLKPLGAEGIGLYRTEVPFMVRSDLPGVTVQRQVYQQVFEYADGLPVVFRTLDIGADKVLPGWRSGIEENPAMGWRAVRVCFDRPALMCHQLRALIQAAVGKDLNVMFPMIASVEEFIQARGLLFKELRRHAERGEEAPRSVRVGAMLEVPALITEFADLMREADFVSVGTNDLVQFMYASDRTNYQVAARYDPLSTTTLRVLAHLAETAAVAGKPLSVCGEMASKPLDALALISLGYRHLSISPAAFGRIKATIRSVNLQDFSIYLQRLRTRSASNLRQKLRAYAFDHGISI